MGKPEGKKPLVRPIRRHRWEDNIKMVLREVGCGTVDWIELARDRDRWWAFLNAVTKLWWSRGSVLAFSTQVCGFTSGRSLRIFRAEKNPQHAFLRMGSKAVGPMS